MSNNELQKILGARFKEHTHPTDEAVWSAIEAQLDEKQKDRSGIWFWFLNGIAVALLCTAMQWSGSSVSTQKAEIAQLNNEFTSEVSTPQSPVSSKNGESELSEIRGNGSTERTEKASVKKEFSKPNYPKGNPIRMDEPPALPIVQIQTNSKLETIDNDEVSNGENGKRGTDISVDPLPLIDWNRRYVGAEIEHNFLQRPDATTQSYFKRLPIHLGVEFSYMRRNGAEPDPTMLTGVDTTNSTANNRLTFNRNYEVSTFVQFDFTRRFSASVGFGYSNSAVNFASDTSTSVTSSFNSVTEKSSEMHLFTVPVQAKFNFLQKNRFALNGGLTIQSEFGRITHNKTIVQETWSTPNPQPNGGNQESSTLNTFKIRQLGIEPFVQCSFSLSPRFSLFGNLGYKMYMGQSDVNVAPIGRLNYYNADFGMLFRLK